ncbi:MAG: threonine synthase [Desulfobacterales bacterium]|nr:threonine synthase [Desulfobacterales bacterium]
MNDAIRFTSTREKIDPVRFDEAVLQGFAPGGGLFVPDRLPQFSKADLNQMKELSYPDLCVAVLSNFIDPGIIPPKDLETLVRKSFEGFGHPDILPLVPCPTDSSIRIMELFHGPTLSFKDIAMGFLVRVMDYLLAREGRHLNIILATTGDTGPAAAHAAAGLSTIDCWPLFPKGMITPEQEIQMTGLTAPNIHPVGVRNCPDGGDDLDRVVLDLFRDRDLKTRLNLSSVNSINWCRVMVQSVHYFYAYFRTCEQVGDPIVFSVPSGAFGNLFAGYLAREMGLPVHRFICSVNANQTLNRAFTSGLFKHGDLITTCSSAIDIVIPYNFWRFLYFATGRDTAKISRWMDEFRASGQVQLDAPTREAITKGFQSVSVTDRLTLATIKELYGAGPSYLLDPHGAVALAGASKEDGSMPVVCLATAHPAKFPDIITRALAGPGLPPEATHPSLVPGSDINLDVCDLGNLEQYLINSIGSVSGR